MAASAAGRNGNCVCTSCPMVDMLIERVAYDPLAIFVILAAVLVFLMVRTT